MRCLFIGGSLGGQILTVESGVKFIELRASGVDGYGAKRYVVGEIVDFSGATNPVCYLEGLDPIEHLMNFYELHTWSNRK